MEKIVLPEGWVVDKERSTDNEIVLKKIEDKRILTFYVPIDAQKHGTGQDEVYCNWYDCPKCNNGNVQFEDNYCSNCGSKFEWTGHYS